MEKLISQLKAQNKLINIVRCQPKISKTALSEYLKVSWPTVSTNIEALKKSGIFDPDEGLAINGEFAYMVGLSVGSAQIICLKKSEVIRWKKINRLVITSFSQLLITYLNYNKN